MAYFVTNDERFPATWRSLWCCYVLLVSPTLGLQRGAASAGDVSAADSRSRSVRLPLMRTPALLAAVLAATVNADAGSFVGRGQVVVGPWYSPYGAAFAPPFVYDPFGPCLARLNCADYEQLRRFLDRYERNYGGRIAPGPPAVALPPRPRDVAPTPDAHIQPRYRGASQIRPEFEQSGQERDGPPVPGK